mmetsp:Transcript_49608/g.153192  ORF Transcript_49608/g.153192 Transcript_49608/m.153192 type:complete len:550 (-) Transcript_49608:166-1815(-)
MKIDGEARCEHRRKAPPTANASVRAGAAVSPRCLEQALGTGLLDGIRVLGALERLHTELRTGVDFVGEGLHAIGAAVTRLGLAAVDAHLGGLGLLLLERLLLRELRLLVLLVEHVQRHDLRLAALDGGRLLHRVRAVLELLPRREAVEHGRRAVDLVELPREDPVVVEPRVRDEPREEAAEEHREPLVEREDDARLEVLRHLLHELDVADVLRAAAVDLHAHRAARTRRAHRDAGRVADPRRLHARARVDARVDEAPEPAVAVAGAVEWAEAQQRRVGEVGRDGVLAAGAVVDVVGLGGEGGVEAVAVDNALGAHLAGGPRDVGRADEEGLEVRVAGVLGVVVDGVDEAVSAVGGDVDLDAVGDVALVQLDAVAALVEELREVALRVQQRRVPRRRAHLLDLRVREQLLDDARAEVAGGAEDGDDLGLLRVEAAALVGHADARVGRDKDAPVRHALVTVLTCRDLGLLGGVHVVEILAIEEEALGAVRRRVPVPARRGQRRRRADRHARGRTAHDLLRWCGVVYRCSVTSPVPEKDTRECLLEFRRRPR